MRVPFASSAEGSSARIHRSLGTSEPRNLGTSEPRNLGTAGAPLRCSGADRRAAASAEPVGDRRLRPSDHTETYVPAGRASLWDTVPVQRRILAVVRTFTALDRLHDVFPVLADDLRLEIRFAVAAGSRFTGELADHLRRSHMRVVDWAAISAGAFDLAISPSSNGALHELPMPVMTLPHGAGYHKKPATDAGFTDGVSGLSPEQLVHDGTTPACIRFRTSPRFSLR
ncbi:hypothetical protein N599_23315 [Saccharopolyspora erythraea D]|nr:hypothetical protein N599_23315 [Saccharopolyspora erythraea D]